MIKFLLAVVLAPSLGNSQIWKQVVPEDALQIGESYYGFIEAPGISWEEADLKARDLKGQLARLDRDAYKALDSGLGGDVYMWVGAYKTEGSVFSHFDGTPLEGQSSLGFRVEYGDGRRVPGYMFVGPDVGASRRALGVYTSGIESFAVDGFLCEWKIQSDILQEAAKTVSLKAATEASRDTNSAIGNIVDDYQARKTVESIVLRGGIKVSGVVHRADSTGVTVRNFKFDVKKIPLAQIAEESRAVLRPYFKREIPDFQFEFLTETDVTKAMGRGFPFSPFRVGPPVAKDNDLLSPISSVEIKNLGSEPMIDLTILADIDLRRSYTSKSGFSKGPDIQLKESITIEANQSFKFVVLHPPSDADALKASNPFSVVIYHKGQEIAAFSDSGEIETNDQTK